MNVDEKIRAAMHLEPIAAPPRTDEWASFERRARRRTAVRVLGATLALALVAAAAVAVPRWLRGEPQGFVDEGGSRFTDDVVGYDVHIPRGWDLTQTPYEIPERRGWEARPAAVRHEPGVRRFVGLTFAALQPADFDDMVATEAGASVQQDYEVTGARYRRRSTTVAGRRAVRVDIEGGRPSADDRTTFFFVEWPNRWALRFNFHASSPALSQRYARDALGMLESLRPVPYRGPVHRGVKLGGFGGPIDEGYHELMAFLDARATEGSAGSWLGDEATGADVGWLFAHKHGPGAGDTRHDYDSWRIEGGEQVGTGTYLYTVTMIASGAREAVRETIRWGPGRNLDGEERSFIVLALLSQELVPVGGGTSPAYPPAPPSPSESFYPTWTPGPGKTPPPDPESPTQEPISRRT